MSKEQKNNNIRDSIEMLMEHFEKYKLDPNDTDTIRNIQYVLSRIFGEEVRELGYEFDSNDIKNPNNTFGLVFINNPDITYRGRYYPFVKIEKGKVINTPPKIEYNLAMILNGLDSDDKERRLCACRDMFKTIFHELQHHKQYKLACSKISNLDSLRFARDFVTRMFLPKDWYSKDEKTGNYTEYMTENDANETGYSRYLEITGENDPLTSDLRIIYAGKRSISRYKINASIPKKNTKYNSGGYKERDDITIPVIDDAIKDPNARAILRAFPILQKEYNFDGTKKSAVQLITNMKKEIQAINSISEFSQDEKTQLISDCQVMYYELIYRELLKGDTLELKKRFSEEELGNLFSDMSQYFHEIKNKKINDSSQMAAARVRARRDYGRVFFKYNTGTIEAENPSGKRKAMFFEEFIKTINPELLKRNISAKIGPKKMTMPATQYIKKYCFGLIPPNGTLHMKSGKKITAKEFIEEYILNANGKQENIPVNPMVVALNEVVPPSPWVEHKDTVTKLRKYYNQKIEKIKDIAKKLNLQMHFIDLREDIEVNEDIIQVPDTNSDVTINIEDLVAADNEVLDENGYMELGDTVETIGEFSYQEDEPILLLEDIVSSTLKFGVTRRNITEIGEEIFASKTTEKEEDEQLQDK